MYLPSHPFPSLSLSLMLSLTLPSPLTPSIKFQASLTPELNNTHQTGQTYSSFHSALSSCCFLVSHRWPWPVSDDTVERGFSFSQPKMHPSVCKAYHRLSCYGTQYTISLCCIINLWNMHVYTDQDNLVVRSEHLSVLSLQSSSLAYSDPSDHHVVDMDVMRSSFVIL